MVFATRLKPILKDDALPAGGDGLSIALSNIKTGPLSAITNLQATNLVTKPGGATLQVTMGPWSLATGENKPRLKAVAASVDWQEASYFPENVRPTVEQVCRRTMKTERTLALLRSWSRSLTI